MRLRDAIRVLRGGDGICGFRETERYDEAIATVLAKWEALRG